MYNYYINGQLAEISLATIKEFYAKNEDLFDIAVDAVVRGCVSEYNFDYKKQKFIGIVTSFDGSEVYEVQVWYMSLKRKP